MLVSALGQTTFDYDELVQRGKTQLQAGTADLALATGEAATKMNPDRWEGYALAGGALMNLKRFEEAADKLSEAIKRAPEAKQPALRDLRRQCLLAESGAPSARKEAAQPTTSQAEIVLWKTIENSNNPNDFDAYLKQYPNGAFAPLATARLREPTWVRIQNSKNPDDFAAFLRRFPDGDQAVMARARMEMLQGYARNCGNGKGLNESGNNAPSLESSLKCIEDTVNELGRVVSTRRLQHYHEQEILEYSDFHGDPGACAIRYTVSSSTSEITYGKARKEKLTGETSNKVTVDLKDIKDMSVMSAEDYCKHTHKLDDSRATISRRDGISKDDSCSYGSPTWRLVALRPSGPDPLLSFKDQDTANLVAMAMLRVVKLCGGGPR
jgi:tetratricopeptide (TPR) repeat protein